MAAPGEPPRSAHARRGFACALSALQFAEHDLPYTIGASFDVLPAAVFLHVYLAFPEGRLRSWFERGLVGAAYVSAIGLQLVKLAVSEFGPNNLLEVSVRPDLAQIVTRAQLLSLAAFCLIGIAVLALRRRTAGPPLRRSLALLVNSFALALLMIAVLFVSGVIGAFDGHTFQTIQRLTLFVVGLAPIVFLIAILDARLARSAVGDLVVELRTHPAPDASRGAGPRPARSVAETGVLAARSRRLRRSRGPTGRGRRYSSRGDASTRGHASRPSSTTPRSVRRRNFATPSAQRPGSRSRTDGSTPSSERGSRNCVGLAHA